MTGVGVEALNQATVRVFAVKVRRSPQADGSSAASLLPKDWEARERNAGVQCRLTLRPPVLVPQFQLLSHIYHQF